MSTAALPAGRDEAIEPSFFSTPALEQRLDLLQHLIEFGQPPIVLTGDLGAGKTMLVNELCVRAPEHWQVALLDGQAWAASGRDLWALLLEAWGLGATSPTAANGAAAEFDPDAVQLSPAAIAGEQVIRWLQADGVPLVIVDDAHAVPNDLLLQVLAGPAHAVERAALRLLLVGEASLDERLRQPPLRAQLPTLVHSLQMPALLVTEINDYLQARQQSAGLAAVRLPDSAAQRLHYETDGLPGPVYERFVRAVAAVAAHEAEPMRRVPSLPRLGEPTTRRYALAMGLVALAFVVSLIWRALPERGPPDLPSVLETLTLPTPDPSSLKPPTVAVTHLPLNDGAASTPTTTAPAGPESAAAAPEPEPVAEAPAAPPQGVADPAAPATNTVAATAATVAAPAPIVPTESPAPDLAPDAGSAAGQSPVEPPTAVTEATSLAGTPEPPAPPVPSEPENPEPSQPNTPKAAPGSDRRWLQDQPGDAYTLQLLASEDGAKARAALTALGLGDAGHLVKVNRGGRSLYVVLYGSFADRSAAQAAAAKLPAAARAGKPFAKAFKGLQAELGQ